MSESLPNGAVSGGLDQVVAEVVAEITDRLHAGERVDVENYVARHPELADRLRRLLPALAVLDGFSSSAGAGGSASGAGEGEPVCGTLGDFRLIREVGRGGMGIVYEAEQVSLGRRVALKVLPFAATMDPRQLQRFHNEARAAASLHHTNIVPVHGVGCERGVHYYAMQFIEGRTLADFIARQRGDTPSNVPTAAEAAAASAPTVPPAAQATSAAPRGAAYFRRAAEWGIQAAEALDRAHTLGVVHRDVKPANLLVDAAGRLWVTDFGLAQVRSDARLTLTGDLVGTLRYMSPEQALAKRAVIDHRTDLYSLGATLYELLTLEPAYTGGDRQELLRQIAFEEPKPPRRVNKAIPAELEAIVLKALEKNPADRYATAKELADDLRRWLDGRLIRARRPTLVQHAQKWLRRHPAVVRSAMLLLLLAAMACATGGWLLWQEKEQTRQQKVLADQARDAAEKRLAQVEKGNDILGSIFGELDPQAEEKGGPALRVQLGERLNQAVQLLEGDIVGDPMAVARLQVVLGNSLRNLGQYEKARPLLEKARQTLEATLGPHHPDTLKGKQRLALVYHNQGDYDRAEALYREVLQARATQLGDDHPDTLITKDCLAALCLEQGKYDRADVLFREVLQAEADKLGDDHRDTLTTKNNLAELYQVQGNYARAEALHLEVLRARIAKLGDDHPDVQQSKHNLGVLYECQGKYDRAEVLLREVLQAQTIMLGPNHPLCLVTKSNLARVYDRQGEHQQAEALFREVVRASTSKLGDDHPQSLSTKHDLAMLYRHQKRYDLAEACFKEVLQARTAKLGDDHADTLNCKHSLAQLYEEMAEYSRAELLYRQVLKAFTAKLGDDHPSTLTSKHNLAVLYYRMRKLNQSVPLFEELVRSRKVKLGADNPETLRSMFNLAINYWVAGRREEALSLYDEWWPRARAVLPLGSEVRKRGVSDGAEAYTRADRHDKAEPLLRELADLAKQAGAESPPYAGRLAVLGLNLLQQKKHPEAENVLRECLAIREKAEPDAWFTFNTRSLLGGALLGQRKYAEAEPLLLQGYDGMKQRRDKIPPPGLVRLSEALERLVQLYDAWGKKEKADEWRMKLQAERATSKGQAPSDKR